MNRTPPRFSATSCSQCGQDFGPGNHGYSHCEDHADDHRWPSASQIHRVARANPATGAFPGPDRPGRYYAVVNGGPVGLTAYLDRDGDLRWVWDDIEDEEDAWTPEWPCCPTELLIRNVSDGVIEVAKAVAALHVHTRQPVENVRRRLSAALGAVADAGVGVEVSAAFLPMVPAVSREEAHRG